MGEEDLSITEDSTSCSHREHSSDYGIRLGWWWFTHADIPNLARSGLNLTATKSPLPLKGVRTGGSCLPILSVHTTFIFLCRYRTIEHEINKRIRSIEAHPPCQPVVRVIQWKGVA